MAWQELWTRWIDLFLTPLDEPGSRLFHIHLLSSVALAAFWFVFQTHVPFQWKKLKRLFFRKNYWWNASTHVDYKIYLLNSALKLLFFLPLLECSFQISQWTLWTLLKWRGDFGGLSPTPFLLLAFTLFAFVWDDFLRFIHHFFMHKVPWFWEIHKLHHSARVLTPITLFRIHPLESAMATLRNSVSLGVASGVFIFLFESQFHLMTLFGINIFGSLFNLLGSNLRHSQIPLSFGSMERVFISPKQHQIHHSKAPNHYDKNFGVSLSIWDAAVGSLVFSKSVQKPLRFGLQEKFNRDLMDHLLFKSESQPKGVAR